MVDGYNDLIHTETSSKVGLGEIGVWCDKGEKKGGFDIFVTAFIATHFISGKVDANTRNALKAKLMCY